MAIKITAAACVLAAMTSVAVGNFPTAAAAAGKTIVLTPHGHPAAAIREGLRIYGWANAARNTATVDQRGSGNGAGVSQYGNGNYAAVIQRGRNHSAVVSQNGNNNALAVFQTGRGRSYEGTQTGNGKTAIVVQIGR